MDFRIIELLGHGGNKNGKQIFCLQEESHIYPGQLVFSASKQLFIIESCRDIGDFQIKVKDLNGLIPKLRYGGLFNRDNFIGKILLKQCIFIGNWQFYLNLNYLISHNRIFYLCIFLM